MITAEIFDIERNSFVDGPGIRTTVFFKGCNLKCKWCHNPESQKSSPEMMFHGQKCIGCGKCRQICPTPQQCSLCGKCTLYCPADARKICGKKYTIDEVFAEIIKDKAYYDNSGGGVTFSGGECMLQMHFLLQITMKCKEAGIHTAIDTAGHVSWEIFDFVLPNTDLVLYDVKSMDKEVHRKYTGVENTLILENLKKLLKSPVDVWVRVPVIGGVNDNEREFEKLRDFFKENGYPQKLELLPYHSMGEHKYGALGNEAEIFKVPDKETIEKFKNIVLE